jgi:hypothetical protein
MTFVSFSWSAPRAPRRLFAVIVLALATASLTLPAGAVAQVQVPCGVLSQLRESLDDAISAGIGGVRTVISSPYAVSGMQKRDAETNLAMVTHGVHYLQDVNTGTVVPDLAPLLDQLDRAAGDMRDAVEALFQWTGGSGVNYGPMLSLAHPQPSTWTTFDYADQKRNDIYALVNGLQGSCAP